MVVGELARGFVVGIGLVVVVGGGVVVGGFGDSRGFGGIGVVAPHSCDQCTTETCPNPHWGGGGMGMQQ